MSTSDPKQSLPGPKVEELARHWAPGDTLDPAVLARIAKEFFTALPGITEETGVSKNVPAMPQAAVSPESLQPAGFVPSSPAPLPVGTGLQAFDPSSRLGVQATPPGEFSPRPDDLAKAMAPFSFLREARPIFAIPASSTTLTEAWPAALRTFDENAPQREIREATLPGAPTTSDAPQILGNGLRPEASEKGSAYGFLGEARQLAPFGVASVLEPPADPAGELPDFGLSSRSFEVGEVRRDFPILEERVNGRPLIWFDNAATTQKPQAVIDRLSHFYKHENSNVHRAAHELAARSTDAYEGAREKVRRFLNASSSREIVFVRGATEGINLVAQSWGRQNIHKDDEIVITWLEHHANIIPWQMLCAEKGAFLRVAPVDDSGQILLEEYVKLVGPRTRLVSLAHVSNALGTVTPAREMIEIARRRGAVVLLDGAQSVSHMHVDVQLLDCDFFVFSGHKVFAPTGIGALYGKSKILEQTQPWQGGGNMIQDVTFGKTAYNTPPARFEAGTGSIADAVGLGAAVDYVQRIGMPNIARYEHDLLAYALEGLRKVPGLRLIGTAKEKASVISFVVDGFRTEDVGAALNREGIAVRAGHHCAQPIHRRFGLESTVRASLALYNTCEEVDTLVAALWNLSQGYRPGL